LPRLTRIIIRELSTSATLSLATSPALSPISLTIRSLNAPITPPPKHTGAHHERRLERV